jgi:histidinol-phosphatase (PHP family)
MHPEEAVAALKKMGLGIAFTEHADYATHEEADPDATDAPRGIGDFVVDFERYPKEYEKFRGEGVMLGLEFGLTKAYAKLNEKIANSYDYDFILGGVHCIDGVEIYHASKGLLPNEPITQQMTSDDTETVMNCIQQYLKYSREMVEFNGNFYDSFAHMAYFARYAPKPSELCVYENFRREIDALLKAIAERELAFEINTYRYKNYPSAAHEMLKCCRSFKRLGGKYCTFGSDAHKVSNLGRNIDDAIYIARESGLIPVYFKERKPIRCE